MRTHSVILPIAAALLALEPAQAATGSFAGAETSRPLMAPGYAAEYLLGVVIVMLALGAFAFALRRLQGRVAGGQDGLRVRTSLPLGGKERLIVVQVQDENLLLGVSPGGVQLISKLAPTPREANAPQAAGSWLTRTLNRDAANRPDSGGAQ